ncbi:cytochrome P450 2U1-like [Branchiostoma floridae x Branchiostoma belcheri]
MLSEFFTNMAVIVGWIIESVYEILHISGLTLQSFLVFCTVFFLACFLLKRCRNLPPYPAGRVPVLGHLLALGRAPHLKLTAWRRQYRDVFTVRMGMEDVVVLNGYTAVKDALVNRSELFASRPPNYLFDAVFGFGKDFATARWETEVKKRKRFATAALKNLGMKVGTGSIEEKIREEASCLRNRMTEYDERPFDVSNDLTVAAGNVTCSMTIGKRYDYEDETFLNMTCREVLKQNSKIHRVLWDEIASHSENLDRGENPRDFLDFCLLEVEKQEKVDGLTEENVLYMASDLFFAGTDTTNNTLLWGLLYMTLHPDIQSKVQQELDAVVGEDPPALSHRSQLTYVNACLLEVMRIQTIAPFAIPHATTETLKVREYDIPKGIKVLPNLYSLHMDPAYWPDPDRFDPGRFLDAKGDVIKKPEGLMPFSGGRVMSFTFKTPEGAPPPTTDGVLGTTLAPHPFKLCAIPR